MQDQRDSKIREKVRSAYGSVARSGGFGCGCSPAGCCEPGSVITPGDMSLKLGYTQEELSAVPEEANMGLGCGNPQAIASLKPGETVLDLGSGGGFDCFLAARAVGREGFVIGVDMTAEMIDKARENARKAGFENIEFRQGEIEHLPVKDSFVDVVISNCVINLSPDKAKVFNEAYRVLKPGGRLAISDIVATRQLPEAVRCDLALFTGCMAGAAHVHDVEAMLRNAGFVEILINLKEESRAFIRDWAPGRNIEQYVVSATIEAIKQ